MWRDFVSLLNGKRPKHMCGLEACLQVFFIKVRCGVIPLLRCTEALEAIGSALAATLHLVNTDRLRAY
jgi:hypothetical protein